MFLVIDDLPVEAVVDADPVLVCFIYPIHVVLELGSVPIVVLDEGSDEEVGVDHLVLKCYERNLCSECK